MIAEIVDGLLGAGVGAVVGRLSRRKTPSVPTDPPPICGCGDNYALHDPTTRMCFGTRRQSVYNKPTASYYDETVQCPCRQYVGPIPVDSFTSMPVSWGTPVDTSKQTPVQKPVQRPAPTVSKRKTQKGDPDYGPP